MEKEKKLPQKETPPPPTQADTPRARDKSERQAAFLEVFASCGNIRTAAKEIGIHRFTHYTWLDEDNEYAILFQAAKDDWADLCREWARTRGGIGLSEEIYNGKGEYVGLRTKHSDRLLEKMLEANCEEYRQVRKHEVSGPGGGAVKIEVLTGVPQPDNEK